VKAPWYALGLVCAAVCWTPAVSAGESAADPELLEYLGSLDSTEAGWHDYLADHGVQEGEAWQRAHAPAANPAGTRDTAQATTAADKVKHP